MARTRRRYRSAQTYQAYSTPRSKRRLPSKTRQTAIKHVAYTPRNLYVQSEPVISRAHPMVKATIARARLRREVITPCNLERKQRVRTYFGYMSSGNGIGKKPRRKHDNKFNMSSQCRR